MIFCVQKKEFNCEIQQIKSQGQVSKKSLHKLDPFIDECGLVRIKGRLEKSDLSFDSKHQIIIPRGHLSKLVIRFHYQFLKHAGDHSTKRKVLNIWCKKTMQICCEGMYFLSHLRCQKM